MLEEGPGPGLSPAWEALRTSCSVLTSQPPGARHGSPWARPVTALSSGAPSHLVAAPMGSNLLPVDSSSQLSNLTGFALVFESGDPLPSPGCRHVDMHENPVSADPGPVTTQNSPLWKTFTQAGEKGHILISAACPAC